MTFAQNNTQSSWWFDIGILAIVLSIVHFAFLGTPFLFTPDEGRYVEIPREMLASGQFIVPHLDGVIYFEKPALYYWLIAGMIKLFGYSEWAVRSMPATLGVFGCLMTYFTARKLFNRRCGIFAAIILSSCILYFSMSHLITMDMPLTFFLTGSLYSFILGMQQPKGHKRDGWLLAAYVFSGLAVMTKGLIGIVFPGMIIGFWIILLSRWSILKEMRLIMGLLIVLLISVPWLLLVQKQQPDFLNFYFINQQLARYATPIASRHMATLSYIGVFLLGFFPWTVILPQSIRFNLFSQWKKRHAQDIGLFFLIWFAAIFLFFAFSNSILIPYLLPIMPPLAIITARYCDQIWNASANNRQKLSCWAYFIVCLLLAITLILLPHYHQFANTKSTLSILWLIAVIYLVSGSCVIYMMYRKSLSYILCTMAISSYLALICAWSVSSSISARSIKPLAQEIVQLQQKHADTLIVNYGNYHQDLPYYTAQKVIIVNWQNELTFGYSHQADAKEWMVDDQAFWPMWNGKKGYYMILSQKDFERYQHQYHLYKIDSTLNDVLVTNKDYLK